MEISVFSVGQCHVFKIYWRDGGFKGIAEMFGVNGVKALLIGLGLSLLMPSEALSVERKIVLNTGIRDPFTTLEGDGFIDLVVHEAFRRLGKEGRVLVYQNAAKSLDNANQGIDDGVALRIAGLTKRYPNLVQVPEKIMDNDFVAYGLEPGNPSSGGWEQLDDKKLSYIKGWQIFQNNLADHALTTISTDPQQMFDLLVTKQVELILYERWQGLWRAEQLGLTLHSWEPPLVKMEMFIYLHRKHEELVEPLAAALRDMKRDGFYDGVFTEKLEALRK